MNRFKTTPYHSALLTSRLFGVTPASTATPERPPAPGPPSCDERVEPSLSGPTAQSGEAGQPTGQKESSIRLTSPVGHKAVVDHCAAQAVMRRLLGLRISEMHAVEDGGYCFGPNRSLFPEERLLIMLAGFAHQVRYRAADIDWSAAHGSEIMRARLSIERYSELDWHLEGCTPDPSRALPYVNRQLQAWMNYACSQLLPYKGVVEQLGCHLADGGRMNGLSVAHIIMQAVIRLGAPPMENSRIRKAGAHPSLPDPRWSRQPSAYVLPVEVVGDP